MCLEIKYLIYVYKKDLALNNLQWFICHQIKLNQTKLDCVIAKESNQPIAQSDTSGEYVIKI